MSYDLRGGATRLKRLNRNPEKFEPLELYDAIGRNLGYKLNVAQNRADFIKRIDESIKAASENSALIHGKRVEAMFAHVAGGLGQCAFIKQEDAGDVLPTTISFKPRTIG